MLRTCRALLVGANVRRAGLVGQRFGTRAFANAALARTPARRDRGEAQLDELEDGGLKQVEGAEPSTLASVTDGGAAFRSEHQIDVSGDLNKCNISPAVSFAEVYQVLDKLSRPLAKRAEQTFKDLGYTTPSVIQAQSWPITLSGRDCIGISKTGSGKTMGFMLPAVAKVVLNKPELQRNRKYGPYVVVLAPTRELAQQIFAEAEKLTHPNGLGIVCTFGGESRSAQSMRVMRASRSRKFDVLVSTPGRLQDLIDDSTVVLDSTQLLVLDEADRMLDMGFEPQIRAIANAMPAPAERQTLLFSATWPREVQHLAADFTHEPLKITIGETNELSANRDITQRIVVLRGGGRSKMDELLGVLGVGAGPDDKDAAPEGSRGGGKPSSAVPQALVFTNRKATCDDLEAMLQNERVRVAALHGDLTQRRRDNVIQQFKANRIDVLVATDVAARGLDIKGLDMVVNYDFPLALEDYVHRIGRTGRAGRKGEAISFLSPQDAKHAGRLIQLLRKHDQHVSPELEALAPSGGGGGGGGRFGARRFGGALQARGGYGGARFGRSGSGPGSGSGRDDFAPRRGSGGSDPRGGRGDSRGSSGDSRGSSSDYAPRSRPDRSAGRGDDSAGFRQGDSQGRSERGWSSGR